MNFYSGLEAFPREELDPKRRPKTHYKDLHLPRLSVKDPNSSGTLVDFEHGPVRLNLWEVNASAMHDPDTEQLADFCLTRYVELMASDYDHFPWPPLGISALRNFDPQDPSSYPGMIRLMRNQMLEYLFKERPKFHPYIGFTSRDNINNGGLLTNPLNHNLDTSEAVAFSATVDVPEGQRDHWLERGVIDPRYRGQGLGILMTARVIDTSFRNPATSGVDRTKLDVVTMVRRDGLHRVDEILKASDPFRRFYVDILDPDPKYLHKIF